MFDKIKHGYPPSFDVSQYFVAFCFHDFCQFGKFEVFLGAMVEINIDTLQKLSMQKIKCTFERVYIVKFVQFVQLTIQCTLMTKKTY